MTDINIHTSHIYLSSDVSVGLRVVWAGGKNSLVERIWPGGNVPVTISKKLESKSYGFPLLSLALYYISNSKSYGFSD